MMNESTEQRSARSWERPEGASFASWMESRLARFATEVPTYVSTAREAVAALPWGERILEALPTTEELLRELDLGALARRAGTSLAGGLVAVMLVLLVGVWIGLSPKRNMVAVIELLPASARPRARTVGDACHRALRLWLLGRLIDMSILATLTGIGLAAIGMPQPLALAITAGLFEFVPYVGPFLAVAPIAVTALAVAPELVWKAALVYGSLQIAQSYVITPLVEQKAVSVPPAVGISAQVVATYLAGPVGLLLATPCVVITVVLVQSLWIEDAMHEDVQVLGT